MKESNRTYYGEYSLGYWIKLIRSGGVVLPEYQRHFVWGKSKIIGLIDALKSGRFVPPITLGAYREENKVTNLIIDGQQRLTSLLLAYIGRCPILSKFELKEMNLATDDLVDDDAEESGFDFRREWTFNRIIDKTDNTHEELVERCSGDSYEDVGIKLSDADLRNIFLGFSYIVPGSRDPAEQQAYYTREFMELNTTRVELNPLESRRSLYFWNDKYKAFFEPEFCKVVIHRSAQKSRIRCLDFARYLALASNYLKCGSGPEIAKGWEKNLEGLYFAYICSVVQQCETPEFPLFTDIFPDGSFKDRMLSLQKSAADMHLLKEYDSIIDLDMRFFGLVYWVVLKGCRLNSSMLNDLENALQFKIEAFRKDPVHARAPGITRLLRQRIVESCEIYEKRVINE